MKGNVIEFLYIYSFIVLIFLFINCYDFSYFLFILLYLFLNAFQKIAFNEYTSFKKINILAMKILF